MTARGLIGKVFAGRYELVELLGRGGLAEVYLARDLQLPREVALKVLESHMAEDSVLRQRFQREAVVLAGMSHPNIVPVIDYGLDADVGYLVMERLHGQTLRQRLDGAGAVSFREAKSITAQVLRALTYARTQSVIHRDLKPPNVFLQRMPDDVLHVRILDFGFAKLVTGDPARDGVSLTEAGVGFGTPFYMAPEQFAGEEADPRTDLYAVGIMMFEMLSGARPFDGELEEIARKKLTEAPPLLEDVIADGHVHPELEAWLRQALATRREDRFASPDVALEALLALPEDGLLQRRASRLKRIGHVPWVAAACALPILAIIVWPNRPPEPPAQDMVTTTSSSVEMVDLDLGPRNPWGSSVPGPLLKIQKNLLRDGSIDEQSMRVLQAFRQVYPGDSRALLLLGHVYFKRGWRTDAMERYEEAFRLDPAVRGDPDMLKNLVAMVAVESVGSRAEELVRHIYGPEAMESAGAALRTANLSPSARGRLERLRTGER